MRQGVARHKFTPRDKSHTRREPVLLKKNTPNHSLKTFQIRIKRRTKNGTTSWTRWTSLKLVRTSC